VNLAGIAAHLVGGAGVLFANKGRVASQRGVGASTAAKLALTGAALGVTAYSRRLGKRLEQAGDVAVKGATEPSSDTPAEVADAQRQLKVCQWAIPALTAGIAVLNAVEGEQQRPNQVLSGMLAKPRSYSASVRADTGPRPAWLGNATSTLTRKRRVVSDPAPGVVLVSAASWHGRAPNADH